MSLFGSLYSGISGLSAQSKAMGMISDNIANVSTTAYKGAVAQFSTLVNRGNRATVTASYSPGGVRAFAHQTTATQGQLQSTGSGTDAAIAGAGFFVVNGRPEGGGEQLYTRAGAFETDYLGNMRNAAGFYLQGWALDADENVVDVNKLETVNVRQVNGVATATTRLGLGANLDADQAAYAGTYAAGDMAAWAASGGATGAQPQFARDVRVFDSLGRAHNLTMAFLKDAAGSNTWRTEIYGPAAEIDPAAMPSGTVATGTVTFAGDGSLAAASFTPALAGAASGEVGIRWAASSGAADSSIAVDYGTPGATDGLTQFASATDVAFVTQNGAEIGKLNGVTISDEGYLVGSFTNGEERRLYKLPVATFANPAALDPRTGNVYAQTDQSGEYNLRTAGTGGAGSIIPASLEGANVDLADEFTKMIVTQRAYSANSRVISTTDQMLEELISLRR